MTVKSSPVKTSHWPVYAAGNNTFYGLMPDGRVRFDDHEATAAEYAAIPAEIMAAFDQHWATRTHPRCTLCEGGE